jgi:mycothiol synthase
VSLQLRAPSKDEAPALRELIERYSQAVFGETEFSEEEVRHWFTVPGIWMRVAERDGNLVGYLDIAPREEVFNADIRTVDREVADTLIAEAERHVRSMAASSVVRGWAHGGDPMLTEAFTAAGWQLIRHSFQMRIGLSDDLPEPSWPDGLSLRTFRSGEEERVHEASMDAFADHWDFRRQPIEEWRAYTVDHHGFDPSLWWLVEDGDEIAGFTLNSWYFSGDPQFGWVGILGVRPPWRRRGLATALLQHSFRDFRARGATRVGLGVDAENTTGAVRLYERAGMQAVRRTDTYEKTL